MFKYVVLGLLFSFTLNGMHDDIEKGEISLTDQRLIVRNLSWQIFNRESDVQFEKLFLQILSNPKNPKLFPELVAMRAHIQRELQYRVKGDE